MANRIKGITVEIGGDTTKLQTALKGVNTEIRNTQSQLRDVEKLLKLDPGNTELLAQRHRLLGQAVSETKEKLETLKTAAEAMNYMAMAGWKTSDMLSGIEGIMNLAAASGEDLATTSDIVTDALTAFGLSAADSGHFADILAAASSNANTNVSMRDLSDILADCRVAFAGLSDSEKAAAAEALVGKNAMSGFLALMNAAPAAGMAETMQDNLAGQLTILKSQLEELAISFGELLMPSIRMIVGWVQKLVDWLNGMDEGTKKVIMTVALLAAAIGPVLIVIGKVVSAVGTIMTFIPKLVSGFNMLKTAFSALGAVMAANPIILIVAAVAAAVAAIILLYQKCEWFRDAVNAVWAQVKGFFVSAWESICSFFTETIPAAWESLAGILTRFWHGGRGCGSRWGISSVMSGRA